MFTGEHVSVCASDCGVGLVSERRLEVPFRYGGFEVRDGCVSPYYGRIVVVRPWPIIGIVLDRGDIGGRIIFVLRPFPRAFRLLLGRRDALVWG